MGSYTFKWEAPADEVYVTGTFDEWTKSIKLDKIGDIFKKTVPFEDGSQKIYYKFVVDGVWITNEAAAKEADHEGNVNNCIAPEDMASEEPAAAVIQTVTAESTTAALAGQQPIEKNETDAPSDDVNQTFSVDPLPAAIGAVNPIKLAPGEPVPHFAAQDLSSYVKLDKESYERSDALPGIEQSELQPPSFEANMIPESGLPMGVANAALINTVSPTTLDLAGQVPLEPKIPHVVKESQEEGQEKAQVEEELKSKAPEAPAAETPAAPDAATQEVKESVPEPSTEAAASTAVIEEKTEAEPVVAEETKTEEVPHTAVVAEAPKIEIEKREGLAIQAPGPQVIQTEAPAAEVAQPAAEPATEAPTTTESKEPESAPATHVHDSAEVAPAAERPTVEVPPTETPSERTEVSPTAEAPQADTQVNGEDKSGETPSDKKRKNRLSVYLQKFRKLF